MNDRLREYVERGDLKEIEDTVRAALAAGESAREILDVMNEALEEVGARFQRKEIFVPDMLVAAMAMQRGVGVLKPLFREEDPVNRGKYIIGTVRGDLHDIGKNLVMMLLEASGFKVIDLGVDVPPERFIEAIRANPDCHVVGLSALLTTTLSAMGRTVAAITEAGLRDQVKIMVGGTPVTEAFARKIGADAYTSDAAGAVERAKALAAGFSPPGNDAGVL